MACGAIPSQFLPLTAEAPVARRPLRNASRVDRRSEKQYQAPAWQEIVDFS
jgi:hypothetical protein